MKLDVIRYYTHLNLVLFAIAVVLSRGLLKTALLMNSIFVGLMGNLIAIRNADRWTRDYPEWTARELLQDNFIGHILPMFLAFIILLGCPPGDGETNKILLLLTGIFMLWATIPYEGKTMGEKVYDSYSMRIGTVILGSMLLTLSTCHAMRYHRA